jgi:site-specific recombinase XerD
MENLTEKQAMCLLIIWQKAKTERAGIAKETKRSINTRVNALSRILTTDDQLAESTIIKVLDSAQHYSYGHRNAKTLIWAMQWCHENKLIETDPLIKVRLPQPNFSHTKIWLTETELQNIETLPLAGKLAETRDFFLLQCHTGLAYCDVQSISRLNRYDMAGREWISIIRQKTKQTATVPVIPKAHEILDRYRWKIVIPSNREYNYRLKKIQQLAGIEKNLHSHVACKTFIQHYLSKGVAPQIAAEMRGITVQTLIAHYGTINTPVIAEQLRIAGL